MTVTPFRVHHERQTALRRRDALDALSDATQWVLATLRNWWRRSRERDQLARLDERMLRDIGVTPGDVWHEINKPFWRQ